MRLFKSILSNTSSQIFSRVISSGTSFVIVVLIARAFGLSGYSDIAKITALVGLFYLGIDLGANAIFLQFDKREQSFSHLLSFRLLLALFVFALLNVVTFFLPYNAATTSGYSPFVKLGILLFSFSFFSQAIVYSAAAFFQQSLSYHRATIATLGGSLTTLILVAVAIIFKMPLVSVIIAYLLGGFFQAAISLLLLSEKKYIAAPSPAFIKKLFFSTLPFSLLLFLNLLYFRVDMILLSLFQKSSAVGIYDYAYKYFDFLIALPLFLSNSLYPLLLEREKNYRIQRKNISLYTLLFFLLGLLILPFVWILSPLIGLVKHDFLASVLPLQLLSLSLPIFFATNILQWIFITKKKQTFLVWIYGISLIGNILLNLIFIPHYSYAASAIITGISEFGVFLAMIIYVFFKTIRL